MIEFVWFLLLLGACIGFSAGRVPSIKGRWGLVIGLLLVCAAWYVIKHGESRVTLNLLLFFDRHTVLLTGLLVFSLFGFVLAWSGQWIRGSVIGGLAIGVTVALFLALEWYCALVLLLMLALFSLLWVSRERLGSLGWICALLVVFLIMGLFISRISYSETRLDYIEAAILIGLGTIGFVWAWHKRFWLISALSAFVIGLIVVGVLLIKFGTDVPQIVDTMGDYVVSVLMLAFIGVLTLWVGRARLQPLGWASAVMIVFLAGGLALANVLYGTPEDFADIEDQFKYGSIGSDHFLARGIPYFIWEALPRKFVPEDILTGSLLPTAGVNKDDYQPRYGKEEANEDGQDQPKKKRVYPKGKTYEAFGLLKESNRTARLVVDDRDVETIVDRPIGFSKRKVFGLDFVGINCAFCHTSTIRKDAASKRQIVLGMPANTVDIELFFLYLFAAVGHPDFTRHGIMAQILADNQDMSLGSQVLAFGIRGTCREIQNGFHRLAYRWILIPLTQWYTARLKRDFSFIDPKHPDHLPRFGPGRVDAWNPGKKTLIMPPLRVDYPGGLIDASAIWNQKARNGMRFHWDGNINNIDERNIIAGLVVNGPQIECLDTKRIRRITDWILERPAPRFDDFEPLPHDPYELLRKRSRGKELFGQWCATCHAADGERIGRVEPLQARELRTDPFRMRAFTTELQNDLNKIERYATGNAEGWRLTNFRVQDGYVNMLLDGIWLRAPYLHNGSVPTLRDLLDVPCEGAGKKHCRPQTFVRGDDRYDSKAVGFKLVNEPGDVLEVIIRGNKPITNIWVRSDGRVYKSGVGGLDGNVAGVTADQLAVQIDTEQELTTQWYRQVSQKIDKAKKRNRTMSSDDVLNILLQDVKLDVGEAERVIAWTDRERSLTEAEVEGLVRKGLERNPLISVRIKRKGLFTFDTRLPGNSNYGHLYGTDLTDDDKDALVEYLKTL